MKKKSGLTIVIQTTKFQNGLLDENSTKITISAWPYSVEINKLNGCTVIVFFLEKDKFSFENGKFTRNWSFLMLESSCSLGNIL